MSKSLPEKKHKSSQALQIRVYLNKSKKNETYNNEEEVIKNYYQNNMGRKKV